LEEGIVYIKSGRCRYVDHFRALAAGNLQVVPSVAAAVGLLHSVDKPLVFLFERSGSDRDLTDIRLLRSLFPSSGIVLIALGLESEERKRFLRAGVNCALQPAAGEKEFRQTLIFLRDYAFGYKPVLQNDASRPFRMPVWKRTFDIVASLASLIVLSPVLLLTMAAIRIDSPGPVIYRSKRVGTNYRIFDFLKFRSMRVDADKKLKKYAKLNQYGSEAAVESEQVAIDASEVERTLPELGAGMLVSDDFVIPETTLQHQRSERQDKAFVKLENDPRVTRVGRFIRKYSIDELPQLINILKGDMSVVGNRPLPLYEAERLTSDEYIDRFLCPSGLTGLWQVEKRGGAGSLSAEERKQLDIRYARTMSWRLDLKIILRTFGAFVQKEDV